MKKSNIPTASDWLNQHLSISHFYGEKEGEMLCFSRDVEKAMKEFAQLHVEAALKAVTLIDLDDVDQMPDANDFEEARELSILNAYPLTNIK